jgi:hypothetical protein
MSTQSWDFTSSKPVLAEFVIHGWLFIQYRKEAKIRWTWDTDKNCRNLLRAVYKIGG